MRWYLCKLVFLYSMIIVSANCPPRESTMACFYSKADRNNDGVITRQELSHKIFSVLRWYEAAPFKLFGGIDRIMKDCDANRDGQLTIEESMAMTHCMDTCFKRTSTKNKFNC